MELDINGIAYALSYALDRIEAELSGVSENHAKWVAYLSCRLGSALGYENALLSDLSCCAALHDNALTQYISEERQNAMQVTIGTHCTYGEANVQSTFPFHTDTRGFILYHHENADGSGPFHKKMEETPLPSQIIHLCDTLDIACNFQDFRKENYEKMCWFLNEGSGSLFDPMLVNLFLAELPMDEYLSLKGQDIDTLLSESIPHEMEEYSFEQVQKIVGLFGRIVDFKSTFTRNHSDAIAKRAKEMGQYYGYSEEKCERLFVAGALHDIGKLAIHNDILEKPDRLSDREFTDMKNHAWYTWKILNRIQGFEDITEWAAFHHEKLNGKGYPFGKVADQLSKEDRLMGCVDIYQALREDRPYKHGMDHDSALQIMRNMATNGFIDPAIAEDLDRVYGVDESHPLA